MAKKVTNHREDALYSQIASILEQNRKSVAVAVNTAMVRTYYEIGRSIVENEQKGSIRAEYGKEVLKNLSTRLTANYGKGFSTTNLKQMRDFYLTYQIGQTVSDQFVLSWSHYLFLMRIDNPDERKFYEIEAKNSNWSLRELKRQFDSALYERLAVSKDKESVRELSKKGCIVDSPADIVKDPYILEFLGLPEQSEYSETELESKLIDKLESFLLELGKGYTFVGRQSRITLDEKHFFVDQVLYNRLLQCFMLVGLSLQEKVGLPCRNHFARRQFADFCQQVSNSVTQQGTVDRIDRREVDAEKCPAFLCCLNLCLIGISSYENKVFAISEKRGIFEHVKTSTERNL